MGLGISDWRLARSVSKRGQMGVVSGAALDLILTRRLQLGDLGGNMRRALAALPDTGIAARILKRYFVEGGKSAEEPFAGKPIVGEKIGQDLADLLVASTFVEVFLAKENHDGVVGINFLHKIQSPLLPCFYGAMLACVDVIIVGAGIPMEVPKVLEGLSRCEAVEMNLQIRDAGRGQSHKLTFDPKNGGREVPESLKRPLFFPIVSSVTLANLLVKKGKGLVDGLIVEGPTAGGHNAPPRGKTVFQPSGEPLYGPRDAIDLEAIKSLGLPFWMAGSYGSPEKLQEARAAGAAGIQVGTLFAFCEESGLRGDLKQNVINSCQSGAPNVFTDPIASPTGFPFKVLSVPGSLSDQEIYTQRPRNCDLGYLREATELPDGTVGWSCPAEDPDNYVSKGGALEDTVGRKCLCNCLMANIGLAQVRGNRGEELPMLTCGDDISDIRQLLPPGKTSYASSDVIDYLLSSNGPQGLG
jgi:nitronate monooxygenase